MQTIVDAWGGDPDSLRAETVRGVVEFVNLYNGEYNCRRLETRLRQTDPLVIFREGRAMTNLPRYKRYLYKTEYTDFQENYRELIEESQAWIWLN